MLNDCVLNAVDDVLNDIFEAPQHDRLIWAHKQTKRLMKLNEKYANCSSKTSLQKEDVRAVRDAVAVYFTRNFQWPSPKDDKSYEDFMTKLRSSVNRYGWKVK